MGDVSTDANHSVVLNCFGTISSSSGISFKARYSCSAKKPITSGGLTWSDGTMSIFDTAHLLDIGSMTKYRTLKSLKM